MKTKPSTLLALATLLSSQAAPSSAKEAEVEIRRAIPARDVVRERPTQLVPVATPDLRQGRGADDAVTTTPDVRQGRGADDAVTTTPDVRQGRGADDTVTTTADVRQGRGADDVVTITPDVRQGRGADDVVTATPDVRQGRGADDAVTTTPDVRQGRGADDAVTTTPDVRQGRGADDAVTTMTDVRQGRAVDDAVTTTPDVRQGRGADDAVTTKPDVRQGLGADDVVTTTPDVRQGRGADDAISAEAEDRGLISDVIAFVANTFGFTDDTQASVQGSGADDAVTTTPDVRQGRGADDVVTTTPDVRQGRGADDAVTTTPDVRQGRGADDAVTTTPDVRQGRGADDVAVTSGTTPSATQRQPGVREDRITFGASKHAKLTAGLTATATHRSNGTAQELEVTINGYVHAPHISTADLENGQIIGNLPNQERLRFALYANAQQAQAAATLWATPAVEAKREDAALAAAETGIIAWDSGNGSTEDNPARRPGTISGLYLRNDRMPELNASFLRGKVIQIYGPVVEIKDVFGKTLSSTRQVYWTTKPIR